MDAQTSGGLLFAVPAENEAALLAALRGGTHSAAGIGRYRPPGLPAESASRDRCKVILHVTASLDRPTHGSAGDAARRGTPGGALPAGTEYIVVAQRVTTVEQHEALIGWLPMTGEELTFRLEDIESFQVIE